MKQQWFGKFGMFLLLLVLGVTLSANDAGKVPSNKQSESAVIPAEVQQSIELRKQIGLQHAKRVILPKKQVQSVNAQQAILPGELQELKERDRAKRAWQAVDRKDHYYPRTTLQSTGERYVPQNQVKSTATLLGLTINGVQADTVQIGEGGVLNFTFPAGETEALLEIIVDVNEDGILGPEDISVDMGQEILLVDNDMKDGDPAEGSYELVMDPDFGEGLLFLQGGLFFEVSSGDDTEAVFLYQTGYETPYSISGWVEDEVTNPLQGIIVMAEWYDATNDNYEVAIDLTDSNGDFSIGLPDMGTVFLYSGDFLMVTGGMYPTPSYYEDVTVEGHVTGYHFTYQFGASVIEGVVTDDLMNPVEGVGIYADGDFDVSFYAETDVEGFYQIQVPPGWYWLGVETETVSPNYLSPPDLDVYVDEEDTTSADFTIYGFNSSISGNVVLDESPAQGIKLYAWNETYGYAMTETDAAGNYSLSVYSGFEDSTYYWVYVDDWDLNNVVVTPDGYWTPAPSSGIDFTLESVNGGLTGFVIDGVTGDTLRGWDVWIWADELDGEYWNGTGVDEMTGEYTLWLPSGFYEYGADADGYMNAYDSVTVGTDLIPLNIYLTPFSFAGDIHGQVVDAESNIGIPYAWMDAWNEEFYFWTETDEYGNYQLDLPAGDFDIWVGADEYFGQDDFVSIRQGDYIERNYQLYSSSGEYPGGLEGYVYDSMTSDPLNGAEVTVGNGEYYDMTYTDGDGFYSVNLPPGMYWINVWAPQYNAVYDSVDVGETYEWRTYYLDYTGGQGEGEVSGVVLDTLTMEPLGGVVVYLASYDMSYSDMTYTNEAGEFFFSGVPYGWYSLLFETEGYYPSYVLDFVVDSGNTSPYFTVYMQGGDFGSAFYGQVTDQNGYSVDYAVIIAENLDMEEPFITLTDESGYYYLPVENGSYQLMVEKPGYQPWYSMVEYDLENDSVEVNVVLHEEGGEGIPPQIIGIEDVPNDQGRQVRMGFLPGEPGWDGVFTGWSVWRELELPTGGYWEFINYVPFHDMEVYVLVAPTLRDSNMYTGPTGNFWSTFMVSGHTPDPYYYLDSEPMSGYSIDNMAPNVPGSLSGVLENGAVHLNWEISAAPDLGYYTVYRGAIPGFAVNNATMVAHSAEPQFIDAPGQDGSFYYRVAATDWNGNESGHSNEVLVTMVGVNGESDIPTDFTLDQNYPNPFNPTTTLNYALPQAGKVTITIYNVLGQPVKLLTNTYQDAGYYTISWDGTNRQGQTVGSGMYLYEIRVTDGSAVRYQTTRKMVLMR